MKKNAYAKINLTLEIIGKRKNGYHNIKSVFQEISLHDTIEIEKSSKLEVTFEPHISAGYSTVHKALNYFEEEIKTRLNVKIKIKKNIPEKSGLGGGSSDAATTLTMLNSIYNNPINRERLLLIAQKIGADVPFFLYGHRAKIEGIGETVTPIPNTKIYGVIVLPVFKFSTEEAYSLVDKLEQWDDGKYTENFVKALNLGNNIYSYLYNHFEKVYKLFKPEFNEFIMEIEKITNRKFHLTGSGSALFYLSNSKKEIEEIVEKLIKNKIRAKSIKTV